MAPEAPPATDPFARAVFDRALLRGRFTLRSGATSDRYFDKFRVTCEPALLAQVAQRLDELRASVAPDATRIVAPALGAVPLATALALRSGLPYAIVRAGAKDYGTAARIEGPVVPGERCVLLEDVVTSGSAALEALDAARSAGLDVGTALCVLDRDGGGREALADRDVHLHALLGAADLDRAFDSGLGTEVGA